MVRVLIAWELGGNLGHVIPLSEIAQSFAQKGCEVHLILKETALSRKYFCDLNVPIYQAPTWKFQRKSINTEPASAAEILASEGYLSEQGLSGLLQCWQDLINLIKPDIAVLDYAPTARLATKTLNIPSVYIGSGFSILPKQLPCPNIRFMDKTVTQKRLQESERKCLSIINSVLRKSKKCECNYVSELFDGDLNFINSIEELDPFKRSEPVVYTGPLITQHNFKQLKFRKDNKKKVFLYLNYYGDNLKQIIKYLNMTDVDFIAYFPNAKNTLPVSSAEQISNTPINLEPLLQQCELAITHGGSSLTAQFVLHGCPVLVIPQSIEQQITGMLLREKGIGEMLFVNKIQNEFESKVQALLDSKDYIENQNLKNKYINSYKENAGKEIAEKALLELL